MVSIIKKRIKKMDGHNVDIVQNEVIAFCNPWHFDNFCIYLLDFVHTKTTEVVSVKL